jgi:Integrase core domain
MKEVVSAPRSPWQNPYVERLIGSIRRECLDHIIIFNESHLRRVLSRYFQYHHWTGHICHSTRIVRSLATYSLLLQARLSHSQRWVVCIIATNVARHDRRIRFGVKDRCIFRPLCSDATESRISIHFAPVADVSDVLTGPETHIPRSAAFHDQPLPIPTSNTFLSSDKNRDSRSPALLQLERCGLEVEVDARRIQEALERDPLHDGGPKRG